MDHLFVICVYWSEPLACGFGVYTIKTFIAIQDDVSNNKHSVSVDAFHLFSHLKTDIRTTKLNNT